MRKIFIFSFIFLSMLTSAVMAQSTMTDQQVLDYAKQGLAAGKSQKDVAQELVAKGVDRAQASRVKKLYEGQAGGAENVDAIENAAAARREHTPNGETAEDVDPMLTQDVEKGSNADAALPDASNEVYGRSVFRNRNLTFAPSANMPTPKNYTLGPGDEVIVDIFGANQSTIRSVISPEGYINVNILGPIYLSGKTIEGANAFLKNKLSAIYGGLNGNDEDATDIQLSLGQIRTIQISIIGEVPSPGTFMVSSLSTVFHAMFRAGGVKEPGTVRSIKVVRNNRMIATIDIYDFLLSGTRKNDIRLEEGDVILVEPYEKLVKINGYVKRPMNFELKGKETIADLLKYAGGFSKSAYTGSISVIRQTNHDYTVSTVDASQFNSFVLQNGDELEVRKMEARFENRIAISGAVYLPGVFELSNEVNSVRKLVEKAGGLQPEAFTERALIHRQLDDRSLETFAVDLEGILDGRKADVPLQKNDELFVHSVFDLKDQGTLTINGEVAVPGTFPFAANTSVQDLILQAGGLLRSASVARVDVARLITDKESVVAQSDIATYFTFSIKDGFALDGADEFILEPYDVVTVRRSPSYVTNKRVTISGEVNFPGTYNMSKREERISDLLNKAGGITDFAYLKGARIVRQMSAGERTQYGEIMRAMVNSDDDMVLNASTNYFVSFDLEDALKNPGGENDLVLREGDVLQIPVYNNTLSISGAVQVPTSINFEKGLSKRDVVSAAGGYVKRAYKRKAFIVYMNGRVAKLKHNTKIEPGSIIYVPKKEEKKVDAANVVGYSTIATSVGMLGVSIANLLK